MQEFIHGFVIIVIYFIVCSSAALWLDFAGSIVVALYLAYCGGKTIREHIRAN